MTKTNVDDFGRNLRSAIRRHWVLFLIPVWTLIGAVLAILIGAFLVWRPFAGLIT